jgi:dipeptidyl aminopeptidase/acylaminoacyl peptidase
VTSDGRFERVLPELLAELGMSAPPDYRNDIVQRTARMRQRPAWMFPERWLPLDFAARPVLIAPMRWRPIAVALLVAALIVAALMAFSSGSRRGLPPPFGPARNGMIVYAANGDIILGDPATGRTVPIVTGPEIDHDPRFSKTGDRFVFLRPTGTGQGEQLMIANPDGSDLRALTKQPFVNVTGGDWSANSRWIVILSQAGERQGMSIIDVDRGTVRPLEMGLEVRDVTFIPPADVEIAFDMGVATTYAVKLDGTGLRVVAPGEAIRYSPDGSSIAFAVTDTAPNGKERMRVHVIDVVGGTERTLENPLGVQYQGTPRWSPDGTRLLVARAYDDRTLRVGIVPVNGTNPDVEFEGAVSGGFGDLTWSPDGTKVVFSPAEPGHDTVVFDVASKAARLYSSWGLPSWQRVAP